MIRAAWLIGLVLLAASAGAQDAAIPHPEPSALFRGWLREQLYRDTALARVDYETAISSDSGPAGERAIALARLLELDRTAGDNAGARRHAALLAGLVDLSRRPGVFPALPREQITDALALPDGDQREQRLERLRRQVFDLATQTRFGMRRYVGLVLQQQQQQESAALTELRNELAAAQLRGDRERAGELLRQLRAIGSASAGEPRREWTRRLMVLITRSHLEGQQREAEQYARILLGVRSRPIPVPTDVDHATLLADARKRLDEFLEESSLSREERQILDSLADRLRDMAADGRSNDAIELLARLPYDFLR
jgi:hypothetical protein